MTIELEPVWQSGLQQTVYRCLLRAMSYPGEVVVFPDAVPEDRTELAVLAALLDNTVTFCDADGRWSEHERAMLSALPATPEEAAFVLFDATVPPPIDYQPALGTVYRPERSATLILAGCRFGEGALELVLRGPGIADRARLTVDGVHPAWFQRRAAWTVDFPTGVDLILCGGGSIAALPRTTGVEWKE